jgi:hypothetical protein
MVSAETILQVWERGQHVPPANRALGLLSIALPDHDRDALANFDLAVRDWHLLRLRLAWFGEELSGCTDCPDCGERLEIAFNASAMANDPPPEPPPYTSRAGGQFRLPNVGDLIAIATIDDPNAAARLLFERCTLDDGAGSDDLMTMFEEVDSCLAAIAVARSIALNVSCAVCGRDSRHALEPAEFLWSEIATQASALLDDVHRLAGAYGWCERDILAMSGARRAAYLSRVDS